MLRTVLEIVAYLLLFLALRAFLRGMFSGPRRDSGASGAGAPQAPPSAATTGELKKDPVCGTYVATSASLSRTVNGQVYYFCSKECRDRFEG